MKTEECISLIATALQGCSDAPYLDADRIVLHILGKREPSFLRAHGDEKLSEQQVADMRRMADERATGKPLAYILGEADFYGRTFRVTPDVLIPRPDTETLIETALGYIQKNFADKKEITIADIGTGSGCIIITLALEISSMLSVIRCKFLATDISAAALEIARQNAERHGVLEKIQFIQGDMLQPLRDRHIDLIVSNPPYIPTEELNRHSGLRAGIQTRGSRVKPGMTNTVGLLFEPLIALDGGVDGQKFVNQIKQSGIPAIIETTGGEITIFS